MFEKRRSLFQTVSGSNSSLERRDTALDALRTLAIVGMVATHSTRMIPISARWEFHRWAMLLEPIIPALFLALAGASLVLSHQNSQRKEGFNHWVWLRRQTWRALGLWLISVVFYLCEDGWHWPDVFIAPGILGTIAFAIVTIGLMLSLPKPFWMILPAILTAAGVHQWMDEHQLHWVWLTSGNSPVLPLVTFAWSGALYTYFGLALANKVAKGSGKEPVFIQAFLLVLGVGALWSFVFLWHKYGIDVLFSKPFGRSDAARVFEVVQGTTTRKVTMGYYNLRPILGLAVAAILVAGHQILRWLRPLMRPGQKWIFAMGRHSLGVYILHLSLLAVAVLIWGKRPFPNAQIGFVVYLALLVVCEAYALFREGRFRKQG